MIPDSLKGKSAWYWGKWATVIFQGISTFYVFRKSIAQMEMPGVVVILGSLLAVALIDLLFIALMNALEEDLQPNELYITRLPYAIGITILYGAIIWIGFQSEGDLSVAPRVAIGVQASVVVMRWTFAYVSQRDTMWQTNFEKKRLREEKADMKRTMRHIRKIKQKQQKRANEACKDEFFQKYIRDVRKTNNLVVEEEQPKVEPKPAEPIRRFSIEAEQPKQLTMPETPYTPILHKNGNGNNHKYSVKPEKPDIYETNDGKWAWDCPNCNSHEEYDKLRGAQIRLGIHLNECEHELIVNPN